MGLRDNFTLLFQKFLLNYYQLFQPQNFGHDFSISWMDIAVTLKNTMIRAPTTCIFYIGFPRTMKSAKKLQTTPIYCTSDTNALFPLVEPMLKNSCTKKFESAQRMIRIHYSRPYVKILRVEYGYFSLFPWRRAYSISTELNIETNATNA